MSTPPSSPARAAARRLFPRIFHRGEVAAAPAPAQPGLDGRWIAALIAVAWVALLVTALRQFAPGPTWAWFGVPYMGASFSDLYPFPAAQQTLAAGGYIYTPMAIEHWHRPYNYPALWLTFMRFSEAQIPMLGLAMIGAWLATFAAVCGRLTVRQGLLVGFLVCSPVTVLALERANTDVIIFCVVGASLVFWHNGRRALAWSGLMLAAALKLFPVFAFGCFLRLGWRKAWPWLAAAAGGLALLCVLQLDEIRGVMRETPKGGMFSYGATVWVHVVNLLFAQKTGIAGAFDAYLRPTMLASVVLVGAAFVAGYRRARATSDLPAEDPPIDPFRAGAGMFLATFLLGSHFVYRLIFLLLCVPWLVRGSAAGGRDLRRGCLLAVGAIVVAMWMNPFWHRDLYFVRECAVWTLAPTLAWLLGRTLPPLDLRTFAAWGRPAVAGNP